jgi:ribosome biogenesis protein Nip4
MLSENREEITFLVCREEESIICDGELFGDVAVLIRKRELDVLGRQLRGGHRQWNDLRCIKKATQRDVGHYLKSHRIHCRRGQRSRLPGRRGRGLG